MIIDIILEFMFKYMINHNDCIKTNYEFLCIYTVYMSSNVYPLGSCRTWKKNKMSAALHLNGYGNSPDDSALRSPPLSARTPGPVPASAPYMVSATSTMLDSEYLFTRSWTSALIVLHWCCSIIISSVFVFFSTFLILTLHRCDHTQEFSSRPEERHWPGRDSPVSYRHPFTSSI